MIRFITRKGDDIFINPDRVDTVSKDGGGSIIEMGDCIIFVKGCPFEVASKLSVSWNTGTPDKEGLYLTRTVTGVTGVKVWVKGKWSDKSEITKWIEVPE